jgi:hypothetical protein
MTDYTIYKTKEDLINIINSCGLPPTILAYLLREFVGQLEAIAADNIKKELENQKEEGNPRSENDIKEE